MYLSILSLLFYHFDDVERGKMRYDVCVSFVGNKSSHSGGILSVNRHGECIEMIEMLLSLLFYHFDDAKRENIRWDVCVSCVV